MIEFDTILDLISSGKTGKVLNTLRSNLPLFSKDIQQQIVVFSSQFSRLTKDRNLFRLSHAEYVQKSIEIDSWVFEIMYEYYKEDTFNEKILEYSKKSSINFESSNNQSDEKEPNVDKIIQAILNNRITKTHGKIHIMYAIIMGIFIFSVLLFLIIPSSEGVKYYKPIIKGNIIKFNYHFFKPKGDAELNYLFTFILKDTKNFYLTEDSFKNPTNSLLQESRIIEEDRDDGVNFLRLILNLNEDDVRFGWEIRLKNFKPGGQLSYDDFDPPTLCSRTSSKCAKKFRFIDSLYLFKVEIIFIFFFVLTTLTVLFTLKKKS